MSVSAVRATEAVPQPSFAFQQLAAGGDGLRPIARTVRHCQYVRISSCGSAAIIQAVALVTQLAQLLFFLSAHASSQLCDWLHMSSCRGVIDNRFCFLPPPSGLFSCSRDQMSVTR